MAKIQWETISDRSDRLHIPEGWIVRSTLLGQVNSYKTPQSVSVHQVVVQDKNHVWSLEEEENE